MVSTYTASNRLEKPATGDYIDSWGEQVNENLDLIDKSMDGIAQLALTANTTLTTVDGAADQARNRIIQITSSTGDYTVTLPAVVKWYDLINDDTDNFITFKVSGGSNTLIVAPGRRIQVFSTGTEIRPLGNQWYMLENADFPAGVSTKNITLDATLYSEWVIEFDGVSHNDAGTPRSLLATVTGTGGLNGTVNTGTITSVNVVNGRLHILCPGKQADSAGRITFSYTSSAISNVFVTPTEDVRLFHGLVSSVGIQWGISTAHYDAGQFRVWAR